MRQSIMAPLVAVALVAAAASTGTAAGRDDETARERAEKELRKGAEEAEKALRQGTERIMKALDLMLRSIPQYAAPEMNENGDIIIRRVNPKKPAPKPEPEQEDGAST